jgi:phage FluMu protein Com
MNQNKKKYLIQCCYCGTLLFKSEAGIFFNIQIKCSKCKKIIKTPEDVIVTLSKNLKGT